MRLIVDKTGTGITMITDEAWTRLRKQMAGLKTETRILRQRNRELQASVEELERITDDQRERIVDFKVEREEALAHVGRMGSLIRGALAAGIPEGRP